MRKSATWMVFLVLASVVLAGCSKEPNKEPESSIETAFEDVVPTQTRGVIKGVVVDEAIRPLDGVAIELKDQARNTTTGVDGLFSFIDLEPGTYFIHASKYGYNSTLTSVQVEAGVDPPIINVPLIANPSEKPYLEVHQWNGILACGVAGQTDMCGAAFYITGGGDQYLFYPYIEMTYGVPSWIQVEVVWDSTQPAGEELKLIQFNETDYRWDFWKNVTGTSPIVSSWNPEEIATHRFGIDSELALSVSSSDVGVAVNQQFSVYLHIFYRFMPPEGWLFWRDGTPPMPDG